MRADEAAGQAPCGQGAVCSRCQGGEGSSVQGWWARAVLGPSVLLRVHSSPKCLQTRDVPTPSQRGPAPPRTWPPSSQWTVSTEAHLSRPVGPQGWVRPGGGGPGVKQTCERGVGAMRSPGAVGVGGFIFYSLAGILVCLAIHRKDSILKRVELTFSGYTPAWLSPIAKILKYFHPH